MWLLILLSKSQRQQSRHRVLNYRSDDEACCVGLKSIFQPSRFVDEPVPDSMHLLNSLVYAYGPFQMAFSWTTWWHLESVPKDFACVHDEWERSSCRHSFPMTCFLIHHDHQRRVGLLLNLVVHQSLRAANLRWSIADRHPSR